MEYIAAVIEEKTYYIEKSKTLAVIEAPSIYEVPEADAEIAGISVYEDKLVVYFAMGRSVCSGCGIIVDTEGAVLYGMTAEDIGVQEMEPDILSPVMTGVWVVSDDKIK